MGVASLAGGLTQSLPPAGGFSQSAVNLRSGARSQLAGLVTAVLAVAVAMFLAPLLDDLPEAVLAAMVMVAILGLLDPQRLRPVRPHRPRRDVGRDRGDRAVPDRGHAARRRGRGRPHPGAGDPPGEPSPGAAAVPTAGGGWTTLPPEDDGGVAGTLLLHVDGPIYTGNAQVTLDAVVGAAQDAVPPVHSVVLEASAVHRVTVPMLDGLRSLHQELATEGFTLRVAGVPPETLEVMRRDAWFVDAEAAGLVFATVDDAVAADD